jgi:hypothetical protein
VDGASRGAFSTLNQITSGNVSTYIASAAIGTAQIADAQITTAKIADGQITFAKLGDASIGTAKIADAQITTAKIIDGQITTAKIGDAQITNAKIGSAEVNELKIAGNSVTIPLSAYTDGETQTNGIFEQIYQSISFTTKGGLVVIMGAVRFRFPSSGHVSGAVLKIRVNGTTIYTADYPQIGGALYVHMNIPNVTYQTSPGAGLTIDFSFLHAGCDDQCWLGKRQLITFEALR